MTNESFSILHHMNKELTAEDIITHLDLEPLEPEGGYFRRVYTGPDLRADYWATGHPTERPVYSSIYYLLTPETHSRVHRLRTDEIYHFYLGDPVELYAVDGDMRASMTLLGQNILASEQLSYRVPEGMWQGSRLAHGGQYALLGTTMAPAFDFDDFELSDRAQWPKNEDPIWQVIEALR